MPETSRPNPGTGASPRRSYDSPLRRQQAAETRRRIVAAGTEIARSVPSWDWSDLTFRAVAVRAGVGERTVYRHFPTERLLHDAVMERLEEEAGVSYDHMTLRSMSAVAARVFDSMRSFEAAALSRPAPDTSFGAEDDRRRRALRQAAGQATGTWPGPKREAVAAALDALWSVPTYERLIAVWDLDHDDAVRVIAWMIDTLVAAVESGSGPRLERRPPAAG